MAVTGPQAEGATDDGNRPRNLRPLAGTGKAPRHRPSGILGLPHKSTPSRAALIPTAPTPRCTVPCPHDPRPAGSSSSCFSKTSVLHRRRLRDSGPWALDPTKLTDVPKLHHTWARGVGRAEARGEDKQRSLLLAGLGRGPSGGPAVLASSTAWPPAPRLGVRVASEAAGLLLHFGPSDGRGHASRELGRGGKRSWVCGPRGQQEAQAWVGSVLPAARWPPGLQGAGPLSCGFFRRCLSSRPRPRERGRVWGKLSV